MYGEELAQHIRVLYGGSMKAGNVAGLMSMPDIDGGLVGGASLDANEFVALIRYRLHAGV
jgi:triosephosphate isomerase